jgi:hypothetical protein
MRARRVASDTGPFAIVPDWVLDLPVSDRAIRLYALLGRYADDTGAAYPGRRTLASRLRASVDSVDRAVRELEEHEALAVERRAAEEGDSDTNRYVLRRVAPEGVAVRLRPGGRTGAAGGGRTAAAGGSRTGAAQTRTSRNENVSPNGETRRPPAVRERDPLWDALAAELGEPATQSERGRRNRALVELREVGATPEEIRRRCSLYRSRWPGVELTATALAANWSQLDRPAPTRGVVSRDTLMREALEGLAEERRAG